jgi:hypothetical protein
MILNVYHKTFFMHEKRYIACIPRLKCCTGGTQILAHDDDVQDANSAKFYLDDIAQCNDAEGPHSTHTSQPGCITPIFAALLHEAPPANSPSLPAPSCWEIRGIQHVAKFKESERNAVAVHLAVLRIPSVDSDIVIHLNQPLAISDQSSSATVAHATPAGTPEQGIALFRAILASLKVRDWALFAPPNEDDEDLDDIAGEGAPAC